jgi:very-short-patch-repair endonuclease
MEEFDELCRRQRGVVSRSQALAAGLSPDAIRARLDSGRWQRVATGTYATFTGEVSRAARRWAALLRLGPDAVLSHLSAAEEIGLTGESAGPVHVSMPAVCSPTPVAGIVIHRSRYLELRRHPSRLPPQTRVEDTVLDLAEAARDLDEAVGWVATACGRRLTTSTRVARAMAARGRLRRRAELRDAVAVVALGCHSVLEWRYLRDVEQAHALPSGHRQQRRSRRGGSYVDDVHYRDHAVRVELDGRAAHPEHARWRDHRRDNAATQSGDAVLRYGYADVVERPCEVAAQVAAVLHRNGWSGFLGRCVACAA